MPPTCAFEPLGMVTLTDEHLRAPRLAGYPSGCTEATLLKQGFTREQLSELVFEGLAKLRAVSGPVPGEDHQGGTEGDRGDSAAGLMKRGGSTAGRVGNAERRRRPTKSYRRRLSYTEPSRGTRRDRTEVSRPVARPYAPGESQNRRDLSIMLSATAGRRGPTGGTRRQCQYSGEHLLPPAFGHRLLGPP
jgi:hypothetical protein